MDVRTSVVINRPIQEVWAFIDDHKNDFKWRRPSLQRLDTISPGPVGPGTRYEGVVAIGPKKYPYVTEITAYEPPHRVAWKGVSSAGWSIGRKGSYTLEAEGPGRTRFIHDITLEPQTTLGRLTAPLVGPMGSNLVMPLLKQLKEAVEQQPTTTA